MKTLTEVVKEAMIMKNMGKLSDNQYELLIRIGFYEASKSPVSPKIMELITNDKFGCNGETK